MVIPFYLPPRKRKNGVFIYRKLAFVNIDALRAHLVEAGFSTRVIERILSKLTPISREEMKRILEDIGLGVKDISQALDDVPVEECPVSEEPAKEPQPAKDTKTDEPVALDTPIAKTKSGTRSRRRRSSRKK